MDWRFSHGNWSTRRGNRRETHNNSQTELARLHVDQQTRDLRTEFEGIQGTGSPVAVSMDIAARALILAGVWDLGFGVSRFLTGFAVFVSLVTRKRKHDKSNAND